MTLTEITENSEIFTDETFDDEDLIKFANKAISRINTECKTLFPFFEDAITDYTAIPKMWLLDLVSTYIAYGIKMNDSSLSEADRYLEEFYRALNNFKDILGTLVENYDKENTDSGVSPDMIADLGFGGVYQIDTSNAINVGFFGNSGNGGRW